MRSGQKFEFDEMIQIPDKSLHIVVNGTQSWL